MNVSLLCHLIGTVAILLSVSVMAQSEFNSNNILVTKRGLDSKIAHQIITLQDRSIPEHLKDHYKPYVVRVLYPEGTTISYRREQLFQGVIYDIEAFCAERTSYFVGVNEKKNPNHCIVNFLSEQKSKCIFLDMLQEFKSDK